jgi:hypothetical protein
MTEPRSVAAALVGIGAGFVLLALVAAIGK